MGVGNYPMPGQWEATAVFSRLTMQAGIGGRNPVEQIPRFYQFIFQRAANAVGPWEAVVRSYSPPIEVNIGGFSAVV